jgi:hypothetical protein
MRARVFLRFLPLLAPFLAAGAASAQPAQPLDRLLPEIRRNVPGQFLDAESANQDGNPRYHLKWLTPDGRVMWLDADARTGRVMGRAPGRDTFDNARPRPDDNGGPPDRGGEGRSTNTQRYERGGDDGRFERRQFRPSDNGDDARGRPPQRNFDTGGERGQGGFGGRFERGGNDRGPNTDRGFGGRPDFGNRGDRGGFGNRNFGGSRNRGQRQ